MNYEKIKSRFLGKHVMIYLKNMSMIAQNSAGESMTTSGVIEGYVLDADDDGVYLGSTKKEIDKLVTEDIVGIIELAISVPEVHFIGDVNDDSDWH